MQAVLLLLVFVVAGVQSQSTSYTLAAAQNTAGLAYTFSLPGSVSSETNPTIALTACQVVTFTIPTGHPLSISPAGADPLADFPAAGTTGTKDWTVPSSLVGKDLLYKCIYHPTMTGKMTVAAPACAAGTSFDPAKCACVQTTPPCTTTCTAPKVLNPDACTCGCPSTAPNATTCQTQGRSFNADTCACGACTTTCTSPKVLNADRCTCGCPATTCPTGQTLNADTCVCSTAPCTTTCTAPKVLNNSCTCVCPSAVGSATVDSCAAQGRSYNADTCACGACTTTCTSPKVLNADRCTCGCPATTCPTGQTLNADTCVCSTAPCTTTCTSPKVLNADTCTCGCPSTAPTASSCLTQGKVLNQDTCACGACVNTCAAPKVVSDTCTCVCPAGSPTADTCKAQGQSFNPSTCACVPLCTTTCLSPKTINLDICQCVCLSLPCPTGQKMNADTCVCQASCPPTTCPTGQTLDQTSCRCVASGCSLTCPSGQTLDQASCTCVTNGCPTAKCAAPFVATPPQCNCACPTTIKCDTGATLNPQTCTCGSAPCTTTCSSPFKLTSDCKCACEAADVPCENGQARNLDTCLCPAVCTSDCAAGTVRVPGTCDCKACPETCSSCQFREGSLFCSACVSDNFVLSFGKCAPLPSCGPSTYLAATACVSCLDRIVGCKEGSCSSEGKLTCTSCLEGFTLTDSFGCAAPPAPPAACDAGQYLTTTSEGFTCSVCTPIPGCRSVKCASAGSSVCLECESGLLLTDKGCVRRTTCNAAENRGCDSPSFPVCAGSVCATEGFCASLVVKRQTCAEDGTTPASETVGLVFHHKLQATCSEIVKIGNLIEKIASKVRENLVAWDGTVTASVANCVDDVVPTSGKRQTTSSSATVTSQVLLTGPSASAQTGTAQQGMDTLNNSDGTSPTLQNSEVITDVPASTESGSDGLSGGAIAGIIIGCIVGAILVVAIVVLLTSKKGSVDRV